MAKMQLDQLGEPIESLIARVVVRRLLLAGYSIEIQNGEETTLKASRDYRKILSAMATTDDEHLIVRKPKTQASFVTFYYGNGEDLIHDFGVTLSPIMDSINAEMVWDIARAAMDKEL